MRETETKKDRWTDRQADKQRDKERETVVFRWQTDRERCETERGKGKREP